MMIRAPRTGSCCPSIAMGTCDSQLSSSEDSVLPWDVYHEPAWLATRVVIVQVDEWGDDATVICFALAGMDKQWRGMRGKAENEGTCT